MPRHSVTVDLGPVIPESDAAVPRPIREDSEGGPLAVFPLRRGDRVGRYRVRDRLGHGGMGVVFSAIDPELGRCVALKLVRHRAGERPDPRHTARLRREARALARLNHPNVVQLYDLGSTARGIFLAMEFIEGQSLTAWMNERERTPSEVLAAYRQAGRGLAAAHRAGIIHRDFKPTNVIIDPKGHVTVVDFGLARGIERDESTTDDADMDWGVLTERLTKRNVILGTKGFMAPEQLLALDVTPAADQFSFCVSLFEALYLMRPYPGANAVETAKAFAVGEMVEPPPKKGVPRYILRALQRGLAVEPEKRFPNMDELLRALSPRTERRRRRRLAAALFATASLSAALGSWASGDRPAPTQVCVTESPVP